MGGLCFEMSKIKGLKRRYCIVCEADITLRRPNAVYCKDCALIKAKESRKAFYNNKPNYQKIQREIRFKKSVLGLIKYEHTL